MGRHEHEHEHEHKKCGCECGDEHCECGHEHDRCGCGDDHCECDLEHGHAHDHDLAEAPTFSYHVLGIDCPNCALGVQNAVRALAEVEDARLVYATATLDVVMAHDADELECKRQVLKAVRSCGEDLELTDDERERLEAARPWFDEHREAILMGLSALFLVAGLVSEHLMGSEARAVPLYVLAALAGLVFVAPMAIASIRRGTADINVLMAIAVIGALVIGFGGDDSVFGDAALVIFLDQVGEWLEGWSMRRTSGSIRELMDLAPSVSHVVAPDGTVVDVQTKGVEEGHTIRILPGERVPLDGVVTKGQSSFDEAAITGESIPQDKTVGDEVFAGSINADAVVDLRVTADEDCTTLARIVSQVQGAQAQKAPYESFVNRFAAAYTPIVVVGAIMLGVCVPLAISLANGAFDGAVWHDWAYRACSLLVVACPCALVISTPVSFVSALSCAARHGVLVKGGAYFDIATHVTHIAMDKTGTLTTGSPQVVRVVPARGVAEDEVLRVAAALESSSTHPLARAVVAQARERGIAVPEASDVREIAAHGMVASVGGAPCVVGKPAFARERAELGEYLAHAVKALGQDGATSLVVVRGAQALGVVGIADTLRPSAPDVVSALAHGGARQVELLTGDNTLAAGAMARQAGIERVSAELLPAQKLDRIGDLQQAGGVVAMVGDGINDAPALAKADLGVAMGAAASDTALEVADVALLGDDLAQLPAFFHLAVRTMNVVRENIAIAIGVKVLVFVLVVLGVAGMGAAVFADTGVALMVVINGMRLMRQSSLRW